jgi:hypothetical protein
MAARAAEAIKQTKQVQAHTQVQTQAQVQAQSGFLVVKESLLAKLAHAAPVAA